MNATGHVRDLGAVILCYASAGGVHAIARIQYSQYTGMQNSDGDVLPFQWAWMSVVLYLIVLFGVAPTQGVPASVPRSEARDDVQQYSRLHRMVAALKHGLHQYDGFVRTKEENFWLPWWRERRRSMLRGLWPRAGVVG